MLNKLLPKLLVLSLPIRFKVLKFLYQPQKLKESLNRLREQNNTDVVLIVGNGPSLNNTELSSLNCFSIGMNKIHLIFNKTSWRPNVIVVNNGLVLKQMKNVVSTSSIQYYLSFKAFFLGLKGSNISYFLESPHAVCSDDFSRSVGTSATVTFTAMQLALNLGAKKIILVGLDHNFGEIHVKAQNRIEKFRGDDEYHFDKNYFKDQVWGTPDLFASEYGYRLFADNCDKTGVEVFDATVNGKLNIFRKISIDEARTIIAESTATS